MYNLTSGMWAWLSGSGSANQAGIYGSLGVAAAGNVPGARGGHPMVIDSAGRAVYVMGGYGYVTWGNIWRFNEFIGSSSPKLLFSLQMF